MWSEFSLSRLSRTSCTPVIMGEGLTFEKSFFLSKLLFELVNFFKIRLKDLWETNVFWNKILIKQIKKNSKVAPWFSVITEVQLVLHNVDTGERFIIFEICGIWLVLFICATFVYFWTGYKKKISYLTIM